MSVLSRPRALLKYFDRAAQMLSKQMHAVYYYVLIKLPGREIGAVLALHQPLGRAGRQRAHWQHGRRFVPVLLPWHAWHNIGRTLYALIRSNYGGVMGYHATQLVELRGLSAKPEAELQPAPRNRYPQGLRPTEQ